MATKLLAKGLHQNYVSSLQNINDIIPYRDYCTQKKDFSPSIKNTTIIRTLDITHSRYIQSYKRCISNILS